MHGDAAGVGNRHQVAQGIEALGNVLGHGAGSALEPGSAAVVPHQRVDGIQPGRRDLRDPLVGQLRGLELFRMQPDPAMLDQLSARRAGRRKRKGQQEQSGSHSEDSRSWMGCGSGGNGEVQGLFPVVDAASRAIVKWPPGVTTSAVFLPGSTRTSCRTLTSCPRMLHWPGARPVNSNGRLPARGHVDGERLLDQLAGLAQDHHAVGQRQHEGGRRFGQRHRQFRGPLVGHRHHGQEHVVGLRLLPREQDPMAVGLRLRRVGRREGLLRTPCRPPRR